MGKEYSFENMRKKLHIHLLHKMARKGRNGKKRIIVRFLLAVFLLQIIYPLTTFATEPKTIRVGYFAFPGYHEVYQDENGLQGRGYGFDFL